MPKHHMALSTSHFQEVIQTKEHPTTTTTTTTSDPSQAVVGGGAVGGGGSVLVRLPSIHA